MSKWALAFGMIYLLGVMLLAQESKQAGAAVKPIYQNTFEKAEVGKVPDDFLVLEGAFAVKEEGANKFLELPGAPLDTFGVLFGPTESGGVAVMARIQGTSKGRRFPAFGVGLNGVGGYRLQVSPAKKSLELYKGDEVLVTTPFSWESDSWTLLRLQVRKLSGGQWRIEGNAWKQGAAEPTGWSLSQDENAEPIPGRASVWGNPFAGTPIRFDDLMVAPATDKP